MPRKDGTSILKACYVAVADWGSKLFVDHSQNTTFAAGENIILWGNIVENTDSATIANTVRSTTVYGGQRCICTSGSADGELSAPTLIQTEDGARLEGTPGGFVVSTSCLVGRVEVPDALSYRLLRHGAAVGVIASSAPTNTDDSAFRTMGSELSLDAFDVDRLGVLVFDGLIEGKAAGRMVADSRVVLAPQNDINSFALKLMLNFYGDPSLTLYNSAADIP